MSIFKRIKVAPGILLTMLHLLSRLLAFTQRVKVEDPAGRLAPDAEGPIIFALWHNRLFLIPHLLSKRFRSRVHFLASQSRDGGYIADYLCRLGMRPIRGSSSRGGARALVEMKRILRQDDFVAITPDGPRGPRYQVQDGILWLAAKTGAPIVPISFNSKRHWETRGWDRTQIPKPWSHGTLVFAPALHVSKEDVHQDIEAVRQRLRQAMLEITEGDHEPTDTGSGITERDSG